MSFSDVQSDGFPEKMESERKKKFRNGKNECEAR